MDTLFFPHSERVISIRSKFIRGKVSEAMEQNEVKYFIRPNEIHSIRALSSASQFFYSHVIICFFTKKPSPYRKRSAFMKKKKRKLNGNFA